MSRVGGLFLFFDALFHKVNSLFDNLCPGYPKCIRTALQFVRRFLCDSQTEVYTLGNFLAGAACSRRHSLTSLYAPATSIIVLGQKVKGVCKKGMSFPQILCRGGLWPPVSIAIIRIAGKCRAGRPRPAVLPQTARRVVAPYGAPLSAILDPAIIDRTILLCGRPQAAPTEMS